MHILLPPDEEEHRRHTYGSFILMYYFTSPLNLFLDIQELEHLGALLELVLRYP